MKVKLVGNVILVRPESENVRMNPIQVTDLHTSSDKYNNATR